MNKTNQNSLTSLKPGDNVIVVSSNWNNKGYYLRKIESITPKGFIKVDGTLFNPDTGHARGESSSWIREPTPNLIEEAYNQSVMRKAKGIIMRLNNNMNLEDAKKLVETFSKEDF